MYMAQMPLLPNIAKTKRRLAAVKTMAAKGLEQRLLVKLYNQLVNDSVLGYRLGILTL